MDVAGRVVPHGADVQPLQDVERLEQDRALDPGGQLVDVDALVGGADGLLEVDLPVGEIGEGVQTSLFLRAAHEFLGDVAAVEAVVGRHDRILAGGTGSQRFGLGLDELFKGAGEVLLNEDLAGGGGGAVLAVVREEDRLRVRPLRQPVLLALDGVGRLRLDRVAARHVDGGREHVGQAEAAVLGHHHHEPAGGAGRDRGKGAVRGGDVHPALAEELRRGPGGRGAEGVDPDDLARARVVDQRLGLAAPAEHVPHGGGGAQHRGRGVHRIAALHEHHGAGGGSERLARDGDPFLAVQHGFLGPLCVGARSDQKTGEGSDNASGIQPNGHRSTPGQGSRTAWQCYQRGHVHASHG